MSIHENLLGGPPPTLLPDDDVARAALATGVPASQVAADHPALSLPWAALAEHALRAVPNEHPADGRQPADPAAVAAAVEGYAYARVGYHRGLDALRRAGWRGTGPVPWQHEPNQGFLRCLAALGRAAALIGERAEAERCATFLTDCDRDIPDSYRS